VFFGSFGINFSMFFRLLASVILSIGELAALEVLVSFIIGIPNGMGV
jgi:hypothetical protein